MFKPDKLHITATRAMNIDTSPYIHKVQQLIVEVKGIHDA